MLTIKWDELPQARRNLLVFEHLPQPPHELLRSWGFECDGRKRGILCRDRAEAEQIVKSSNEFTAEDLRQHPELDIPPECAGTLKLYEHTWALRYSDTPGGGWEIVEEMRRQGFEVEMLVQPARLAICVRHAKSTSDGWFHMNRPFSEAICIVYLRKMGVRLELPEETFAEVGGAK